MKTQKVTFKKPVVLALASIMALGVVAPLVTINSHAESVNINSLNAGDIILFAGENYIVVDPATGYIVKQTPVTSKNFSSSDSDFYFNPMSAGNIGQYLNNEFLNSIPTDQKSMLTSRMWTVENKYSGELISQIGVRVGLPSLQEIENNPVLAEALNNAWTRTAFKDTERGISKPLAVLNGTSYEYYSVDHIANVHPALRLKPDSMVTLVDRYEAPADSNGVTGDDFTTKVIGTFEATTLDVVIPVTSSFIYNPNTNRIDAQEFTIFNQTNAPVYATMKSIAISPESTWKPSLVAPTAYSAEQWNNLTKEQTQAEVALGIVANESLNWLRGVETNNIWSTQVQDGQKIGVIKTDSPVVVKPTVQSGTALNVNGVLTANYVFEFGLE
ncbi:hypothetical protein CVD28_02895 [Bacillus sp. M6-12]|uniref:hypothetical protein n=1 Tax=Bacillus sp. M6-12 TaxID=2054166 RepID=UPI000C765F11|nr:hypothetical protein [Bacillus sp. M6-12]PLS19379.1 hypothetical protein CVD28_02895 [Bacillus sp. M6-12]